MITKEEIDELLSGFKESILDGVRSLDDVPEDFRGVVALLDGRVFEIYDEPGPEGDEPIVRERMK